MRNQRVTRFARFPADPALPNHYLWCVHGLFTRHLPDLLVGAILPALRAFGLVPGLARADPVDFTGHPPLLLLWCLLWGVWRLVR